MRQSSRLYGIIILILLALALTIWTALWREERQGVLTVSFFNIGQGDATFIDAPSGRQVLIDGGPNSSVLRELGKVMPWYDRSIDVVIGTHPDADHIGGFIDVLPRYSIATIFQSSVIGSTATWNTFERDIAREDAKIVTARRGQVIDLGRGAYLEVLSPDRAVKNTDTNIACVVTRVVYGATSFMLPCDAPQDVENYLVSLDGKNLKSDVLKPGHHGSKTASSPLFVGFVDPSYAVYSRGCDNKYGFPHQETIATFARFGIPTLDTCTDGTITFVSDGQTVARK